jgi:hypothetical protein
MACDVKKYILNNVSLSSGLVLIIPEKRHGKKKLKSLSKLFLLLGRSLDVLGQQL